MAFKLRMKAPKGVRSGEIEGHQYEVPSDGIIDVVSATHVETLKRHGFEEVVVEEAEIDIDSLSKDELIEFCEERGGDTEGLKKAELKALAHELIEE